MQPTTIFHNIRAPVGQLARTPGLTLRKIGNGQWVKDTTGRVRLSLSLDMSAPLDSWIVPCLSITGIGPYSYRSSIMLREGNRNETYDLVSIGHEGLRRQFFQTSQNPPGALGIVEDDCIRIKIPSLCTTLMIDLACNKPSELDNAAITISLSILDQIKSGDAPDPGALMGIPPLSQMEQPASIRSRICSPTCVAMGLRHFGIDTEVADVAAQTYHPGLDIYGAWPAAIYAASQYGIAGFVSGISSANDIVLMAKRNIPLIASVSYQTGELTGSAIPGTPGHLIMVCGIDKQGIVVNDPATANAELARRHYDREEFLRAWNHKKGLSYFMLGPAILP